MFGYAQTDGLTFSDSIRMIRSVFDLTLVEAKEVIIQADLLGTSLEEYQGRILLPALESMLTLDRLISEATALPDEAKALLLDKIVESMASQIDSAPQTRCERDILTEAVQKAQERIAEIDRGAVQTIPGDIALAQIRQLSQKGNE
jgi:Putative addiction module component